jgi:hypothetical protein
MAIRCEARIYTRARVRRELRLRDTQATAPTPWSSSTAVWNRRAVEELLLEATEGFALPSASFAPCRQRTKKASTKARAVKAGVEGAGGVCSEEWEARPRNTFAVAVLPRTSAGGFRSRGLGASSDDAAKLRPLFCLQQGGVQRVSRLGCVWLKPRPAAQLWRPLAQGLTSAQQEPVHLRSRPCLARGPGQDLVAPKMSPSRTQGRWVQWMDEGMRHQLQRGIAHTQTRGDDSMEAWPGERGL